MNDGSYWAPNSMEKTCLKHLDQPGSWAVLRAEKPDETETISLIKLRVVFGYNLLLFAIVLVVVLFGDISRRWPHQHGSP